MKTRDRIQKYNHARVHVAHSSLAQLCHIYTHKNCGTFSCGFISLLFVELEYKFIITI